MALLVEFEPGNNRGRVRDGMQQRSLGCHACMVCPIEIGWHIKSTSHQNALLAFREAVVRSIVSQG